MSSQCRRASAHHHRNHNRRSRAAAPAPAPSLAAVVAAAALAMARAFSGDDVAVAADAAAHCCPARSQYLADRWPAVAVVVAAAAGVLHAPAAAVVALHHPGKATLLPLDNTHVCAARSLLMRKTCSGAACHRSVWPQTPLHRHCHCRSVSPLCVWCHRLQLLSPLVSTR